MLRILLLCLIGMATNIAKPYHHHQWQCKGHFHHHNFQPGQWHQLGQARHPSFHNHRGHWHHHHHHHHRHPPPPGPWYPPGHPNHNHDNWNPPPGFPGHRPCNPPPGYPGHVPGYSNPPPGYTSHNPECPGFTQPTQSSTATIATTTTPEPTTTPIPTTTTPEPTTTPVPTTTTPEPTTTIVTTITLPTTTEIIIAEVLPEVQELQPFPEKGEPTFVVQDPTVNISHVNNSQETVYIPVKFPVYVVRPEENEILTSEEKRSKDAQQNINETSHVLVVLVPENETTVKDESEKNSKDHIVVINADCLKGKNPNCPSDVGYHDNDPVGVIEQVIEGAGLPDYGTKPHEQEIIKHINEFINPGDSEIATTTLQTDEKALKSVIPINTEQENVNIQEPWFSIDPQIDLEDQNDNTTNLPESEVDDMSESAGDHFLDLVKPEFDSQIGEIQPVNVNEKHGVKKNERDLVRQVFGTDKAVVDAINPSDPSKHSLDELLEIQREINAHIEKGLHTYYENQKNNDDKNSEVEQIDCSEQNYHDKINLRFKNSKCKGEFIKDGKIVPKQPVIIESDLRFGNKQ